MTKPFPQFLIYFEFDDKSYSGEVKAFPHADTTVFDVYFGERDNLGFHLYIRIHLSSRWWGIRKVWRQCVTPENPMIYDRALIRAIGKATALTYRLNQL